MPSSLLLSLKRCSLVTKLPDNQDGEISQAICYCHCFCYCKIAKLPLFFVFEEMHQFLQNCPITKMERQVRSGNLPLSLFLFLSLRRRGVKLQNCHCQCFLSLKRCTSFTKLPDNQDGEASQATCHSSQSRLESRLVDWSSF